MSNSLWQQMAIALMAIVLIFGSIMAAGDSYVHSPPPPSHPPAPYYNYMSPPHDPLIIMVIGEVYCFRCQNLHDTKHLLKDATVKVICKAGKKIMEGYGKSKSNGKYNIIVSMKNYYFDNYVKYGPSMICNAKLYAPPKDSSCNIPTKLNEGSNLKVIKFKSKYELVLKAKPFAFATHDIEKCRSPSPQYPYPPNYHYNYSSPSPTPLIPPLPNYYQSPPLPTEFPLSRNRKKSPPPSPSPPPPPPPPYVPPFDFFMLVETWPTSFCKGNPCVKNPPSQFTIHGLWPQNNTSPQPFNCSTTIDVVPWQTFYPLKTDLERDWPDLKNNKANWGYLGFWREEWVKHGTCSLMESSDYFKLALDMYKKDNIKVILQTGGILPGGPRVRQEIVDAIKNRIHVIPQLHCKEGYLVEIRLCFNKSNVYIDCATPWTPSCLPDPNVYFP